MYDYNLFFDGKYDLIQVHRQINNMHQNDEILIEIFTTSISLLEIKVNNKNDKATCAFWAILFQPTAE